MDFLLDNSEFARVKWLGRNSGQVGKSVYLSNSVPERTHPLQFFLIREGAVMASLRSESAWVADVKKDHPRELKSHRLYRESGFMVTATPRNDGMATAEPITNSTNLKRKVT